jgi:hypothetical protein
MPAAGGTKNEDAAEEREGVGAGRRMGRRLRRVTSVTARRAGVKLVGTRSDGGGEKANP